MCLSPPIAHSANTDGQQHDLVEHSLAVATRAEAFGEKFGAAAPAYWAGMWHDIGKIHPDFQDYLHKCEIDPGTRTRGPDHKLAGSLFASQKLALLSFLIAGHHGGLPSRSELKTFLQDATKRQRAEEAIPLIREHLEELEPPTPIALPAYLESQNSHAKLDVEFFIRMIFSALVDADFLDTERHFNRAQSESRGGTPNLSQLRQQLEHDQARFTESPTSRVNSVRQEVYQACLQAADQRQGIFRLTVPTGGGKTRSGMAFALNHALRHHLDRVIVGIPYTSIIEQTADVYHQIFGAGVLEHHSGITAHEDHSDPVSLNDVWSRLTAENWDAPVVVTTTVQLFESLFARKTSACRKLHNIARSVIVLDEVQTLPTHVLEPILDVLKQLVSHYHVSVVLCTATQPALDDSPYLKGLDDIREIVPDPARLFSVLKRVTYEWPRSEETWTWERVAAEMQQADQVLTVLNTKGDAIHVLDALQDEEAFHLSTLLCGAHRRVVLREVRQRLAQGLPCRLISTQVVEAGVDLDFPLVLRALGPLDRIVQAAGRCNREGTLEIGRVVIFDPEEGKLPMGSYRSATDTSRNLMQRPDFDFHNSAFYHEYFQLLYQAVEPDEKNIQSSRKIFDYRAVAEKFRMIQDDSVPVVVRYRGPEGADQTADRLISYIHNPAAHLPRWLLQQLQPYLVNVRSRLINKYQREGLVAELKPGLWEWLGQYDDTKGLTVANRNPEELVI